MSALRIIESAACDGVRLAITTDGKLHYSGDANVIAQWLPVIRDKKADIVLELNRERRRVNVRVTLDDSPQKHYSIVVEDPSTDPVLVTAGIRKIATFELEIPRKYYDPLVLQDPITKYTGGKYANS